MPIHNEVGSAVNYAKQLRMDLDMHAEYTQVPTHSLKWILDTFITLGEPEVPALQLEKAKTVAEFIGKAG